MNVETIFPERLVTSFPSLKPLLEIGSKRGGITEEDTA